MKVLFIGQLALGQTSRMRMQVLRDLGHEVATVDSGERWMAARPLSRATQKALCRGPVINDLNNDVLAAAASFRPDLVWAEKQEYLRPDTLQSIKKTGARLLHYTPDPYFSLHWKRTPLMDESMPLFDYLVTSKRYELRDYEKMPANVLYVPLGFSQAVHRPIVPSLRSQAEKYASDIAFLGGWEPRRERLLDEVNKIPGAKLNIWGYGWDHLADGRTTPRRYFAMKRNAADQSFTVRKNMRLAACVRGGEVYGDEYAWAISSARISVGFLRMICPDQHTTRTFEIPACGSMLLADRTEEHQEFFEEGTEAEFFSTKSELVEKLRYYLKNESARQRVALRGYERCFRNGYSYLERISAVIALLKE